MENIEVICIGAAIVDIPLQPVSKNIFDVFNFYLQVIDSIGVPERIRTSDLPLRRGLRYPICATGT